METFFSVFLYPALMVFVSAFVGWIFARRKNNSEITGIDIDNAKEVIKMYKDFSSEMKMDAEKTRSILKEPQKIIENYKQKCIQPEICKES